jgi:hypothetical protein
MPAFFLTPLGAIATAFSLHNAILQIRKRQPWSWTFWPLAIIFAIVLLGAIAFIVLLIYELHLIIAKEDETWTCRQEVRSTQPLPTAQRDAATQTTTPTANRKPQT